MTNKSRILISTNFAMSTSVKTEINNDAKPWNYQVTFNLPFLQTVITTNPILTKKYYGLIQYYYDVTLINRSKIYNAL